MLSPCSENNAANSPPVAEWLAALFLGEDQMIDRETIRNLNDGVHLAAALSASAPQRHFQTAR